MRNERWGLPGCIVALPSVTVCVLRGENIRKKKWCAHKHLRGPVLTDIYLAPVDMNIEASLDKRVFVKDVRYAGDDLIFFNRTNQQDKKIGNARPFHEKRGKLVFTSEVEGCPGGCS